MSLRKTICDWISANRHTALYMLIGLVVAVGILCFGFWRTLLVALCVGTGYTLGSWRDAIRASWRVSAIFMSAGSTTIPL